MQLGLDFGVAVDLTKLRDDLRAALMELPLLPVRTPIGQLIKSLISGRTLDAESLCAYDRLVAAYPNWADLAAAPVDRVRSLIADVTYADDKARQLLATLRLIGAEHPAFDLEFLRRWPIEDALRWLETLPGVGRKVAASALNFSTLALPAFVADTHVLRVLSRFGLVGCRADAWDAYRVVMAAAVDWSAEELKELHMLLKRLGQTLCRAHTPNCPNCPLRPDCQGASSAPCSP